MTEMNCSRPATVAIALAAATATAIEMFILQTMSSPCVNQVGNQV